MAQNIIYSPWERTKDCWRCLMTTLLLCSLLWLFSFVPSFLTSLIKLILWLKFSTHIGQAEDMVGGDKDRKSCSVSPWHEAVTYTVWPAHKLSLKWGCLPVLKWSSRLFFEERREVLYLPSYRWGDQGHTWSWVWNPGLLIHRVMFLSSLHLLEPGDSFPASTISWAPPPPPWPTLLPQLSSKGGCKKDRDIIGQKYFCLQKKCSLQPLSMFIGSLCSSVCWWTTSVC